jgi:acyl-CoA thioester hydrolase
VSYEFKLTRSVEFSETDMAGIMHFSNFFRFMEAAEHAFFRSLGLSVVLSRFGVGLHLPRVHAECDYLAPIRFEDKILIHLLVQKKGARSLTYQFRFYREHQSARQEVARGRLVVVCAELDPHGTMKAVPLPPVVADKVQEAPASLLADSLVSAGSSSGLQHEPQNNGRPAQHPATGQRKPKLGKASTEPSPNRSKMNS